MRITTAIGMVFFCWSLCSPADAQHPPDGWVSSAPSPSSPFAQSVQEAQSPLIQTGCRMDTCIWFRLKTKTVMGTSETGVLIKLLADSGESTHPEGSYEKPQPIKWGAAAESYVFCSKVKPAIIQRSDKGWIATILAPGNPDDSPGMLREAYVEYLFVCHDLNFSKRVVFDKDVASLGYPASLVEQAGKQTQPASPIDLLDDYRSISFEDFKLDGKDLAAHHIKVRLQGVYKKFGDLETLQPSGLAVAMAREYGNDNGIPLLTDDATRAARKYFLDCGNVPARPLGCSIIILAHADFCTVGNAIASKSVPCLVVEDGK